MLDLFTKYDNTGTGTNSYNSCNFGKLHFFVLFVLIPQDLFCLKKDNNNEVFKNCLMGYRLLRKFIFTQTMLYIFSNYSTN